MERARRPVREPGEQQPARPPDPLGPPGPGVRNVRVIWGPLVQEVQLQDMTVGQAYRVLQAPFNIQAGVEVRVNGEPCDSERQLEAGDTLEFVHKPGEKGARASGPEVHICGDTVSLREGGKELASVGIRPFASVLTQVSDHCLGDELLPRGVRYWYRRGDTLALAVEVPPHTRTVRWLDPGSKRPFGRGASYGDYFIAFPYVVLLLVFHGGTLAPFHQLFYRRAPLDAGEELLLPNLYNVAKGYQQRCWVCLQHLNVDLEPLSWAQRVDAIVDHVFTAAFNRSSEEHEGNSYWQSTKSLDPRVSSIAAWHEASREDPLFPLEVAWKSAGVTMREELHGMLDQFAPARRVQSAADFAGLVTAAQALEERT